MKNVLIVIFSSFVTLVACILIFRQISSRTSLTFWGTSAPTLTTDQLHHQILLQHRIALVEYHNLDVGHSHFSENKTRIIEELERARHEAQQIISTSSAEEISEERKQMYIEFWEEQSIVVDELKQFATALQKIYEYPVESDLDLELEKSQLTERTQAAIKGVQTIRDSLQTLQLHSDRIQLNKEFDDVIVSLQNFVSEPSPQHKKQVKAAYTALQIESWKAEKALLQSEVVIRLLTNNTKLLD